LRLTANASAGLRHGVAISGLDSRRKPSPKTYAAALRKASALRGDSPGNGEAPRKAAETSDVMYSRVRLFATRPGDRQEPHRRARPELGRLLGAKLAHKRENRCGRGLYPSTRSTDTFPPEFFRGRMYTSEYLLDLLPASLFVYA